MLPLGAPPRGGSATFGGTHSEGGDTVSSHHPRCQEARGYTLTSWTFLQIHSICQRTQ